MVGNELLFKVWEAESFKTLDETVKEHQKPSPMWILRYDLFFVGFVHRDLRPKV